MATKIPLQTADKLMRVLMFTMTFSMMSGVMFNIALPKISKEFALTIAQVSWLSSAYIMIYAIGAVTYGKLADRYRLKDIVTFGLLLFALGSVIGLTSQTFGIALVGRCLQAAGAAVIPAISMIIPLRYFAPERRGAAFGMTAVGLAFGNALGPVIAALIISTLHWRWLFAVPLVVLAALPFYRTYLGNEQPGRSSKFDWGGGGLFGITIALLLLSVTNGLWLLIGALLVLSLFMVRIRTAGEPFIAPKLFQNRKYTRGLTLSFLISSSCCSLYVLSPLLLTDVQQLPSLWIGFALVPAAAASAIFGRKGGKLADAKGNSYVAYMASGLLLACFLLLATFAGSSPLFIAVFLVLGNVGQSFIVIAVNNSVSRTLPADQIGVGMGMLSMANFIGQGIAISLYSKAVDLGSASMSNWNPLYSHGSGVIFSNIYVVLAGSQLLILGIYYVSFGRQKLHRKGVVKEATTAS
ncbi:MFS transporter [Paenibacillus qinlingensis]|uniref:DHA2 family metal-tetracycline-proton antiporter-like MFS transporter n=1 Tax=Paenibacillus qinlingensis TaxID=1837343 RepID=A0ABU1P0T9_9BACL|nr:MFS transporter [Paenibacillus qinlingensis]MDR6553366.1 DHA2 family metal-tetracycline-proton antiporter-like MFS transporter [Paenibacillus qinlingensis]